MKDRITFTLEHTYSSEIISVSYETSPLTRSALIEWFDLNVLPALGYQPRSSDE